MDDLRVPTPEDIVSRRFREQVYEAVAEEMRSGKRKEGLWLQAYAEAEGDEEKAKVHYIKYRAQSMLDEAYAEEHVRAEAEAAAKRKGRGELDRNDKQLLEAALNGNLDDAKGAIERGADIDARNQFGATALYLSALHNRVEFAQFLVESGANVSIPNGAGLSPALVAEQHNHSKITEILHSQSRRLEL